MDFRSLNLVQNERVPIQLTHFSPKFSSYNERNGFSKLGFARIEEKSFLEFGISNPNPTLMYRSVVVRASGKKNFGNSSNSESNESSPEEGVSKGSNPAPNKNSFDVTDWRNFRADLISRYEVNEKAKPLGHKWAHSISVPETGCILVATDKLDGVPNFEKTVILLLRSGSKHPHEGPFGVIINRPLHKKIKHMKPTNVDLATTFADCSLYSGGPLEASMFLLNARETPKLPGFEQVIPGLCFGARNNLDEAADMVKKGILRARDFRFFVGYAGWQADQLREEIESDFWYVAACSGNVISGSATTGLWEEILQLMGGRYSEIIKKPKQDS
ncbi:hypothetical protein ACHQM5_022568 [Ranunculus cassubicifolius]